MAEESRIRRVKGLDNVEIGLGQSLGDAEIGLGESKEIGLGVTVWMMGDRIRRVKGDRIRRVKVWMMRR